MKHKRRSRLYWTEIMFSPYILALALAIIIILMLPDIFQPYDAHLTYTGRSEKANSYEVYSDLDGDGYSERIVAYTNTLSEPAVKVLSNTGCSIEQWNFSGRLPERAGFLAYGDTDGDEICEIFLFTLKRDSLLLHAIKPFNDRKVLFKNKLVSTIQWRNDTIQAFVGDAKFFDIDGDGYNEMIFPVKAGFSLQPRGLYVYDNQEDTIYHSSMLGANTGKLLVHASKDEGSPVLFLACNTLGNIHDSLNIPYGDYSSYVMAFDPDLNFLFPPIEYPVYTSSASIAETTFAGRVAIIIYFHNRSEEETPSEILLIEPAGEIIMKKTITKEQQLQNGWHSLSNVIIENNRIAPALLSKEGITLLDDSLRPGKFYQMEGASHLRIMVDLDQDGKREMIFSQTNNRVLILRAGLTDPIYVDAPRNPFSEILFSMSIKRNGDDAPELFIKTDNVVYAYTYGRNPLYFFQYPFWAGIYLVLLMIIFMIRQATKMQLQRKMEIENRLNALQLKTLKSQMDPHFMLNALNSISDNILNKQHDIAYRYLAKYSKLIRMLLTRADKLTVTLEEEISFVEQYLELEQFRLSDKFTYALDISSDTREDTPLPRMLIQLFAENAIKHGIRNKEGKGHIRISTEQYPDKLLITIEDNGIGRQAAKKLSNGYGKGLKIIDEMIVLFEKMRGVTISYDYTDLVDERNNASGTRVTIKIPV